MTIRTAGSGNIKGVKGGFIKLDPIVQGVKKVANPERLKTVGKKAIKTGLRIASRIAEGQPPLQALRDGAKEIVSDAKEQFIGKGTIKGLGKKLVKSSVNKLLDRGKDNQLVKMTTGLIKQGIKRKLGSVGGQLIAKRLKI